MIRSDEAPDPDPAPDPEREILERQRMLGPIEEFARGEVRSYHGVVNKWLLAVYAVLGAWGVYYLFKYWGGLGPGLAR